MKTTVSNGLQRAALISVTDKTGIVDFARGLLAHDFTILSTGGTAKALKDAEIPVTEVADYTGFPEMMDGRLKTLHPRVHGGILGRPEDVRVMAAQNMLSIDVVVVNLYPFEKTVTDPACTFAKAIENIDIGGPTMLRAAAKNHARVAVVCDPSHYGPVLREMDTNHGTLTHRHRLLLAEKVFEHTAKYDAAIQVYLSRYLFGGNPRS